MPSRIQPLSERTIDPCVGLSEHAVVSWYTAIPKFTCGQIKGWYYDHWLVDLRGIASSAAAEWPVSSCQAMPLSQRQASAKDHKACNHEAQPVADSNCWRFIAVTPCYTCHIIPMSLLQRDLNIFWHTHTHRDALRHSTQAKTSDTHMSYQWIYICNHM